MFGDALKNFMAFRELQWNERTKNEPERKKSQRIRSRRQSGIRSLCYCAERKHQTVVSDLFLVAAWPAQFIIILRFFFLVGQVQSLAVSVCLVNGK